MDMTAFGVMGCPQMNYVSRQAPFDALQVNSEDHDDGTLNSTFIPQPWTEHEASNAKKLVPCTMQTITPNSSWRVGVDCANGTLPTHTANRCDGFPNFCVDQNFCGGFSQPNQIKDFQNQHFSRHHLARHDQRSMGSTLNTKLGPDLWPQTSLFTDKAPCMVRTESVDRNDDLSNAASFQPDFAVNGFVHPMMCADIVPGLHRSEVEMSRFEGPSTVKPADVWESSVLEHYRVAVYELTKQNLMLRRQLAAAEATLLQQELPSNNRAIDSGMEDPLTTAAGAKSSRALASAAGAMSSASTPCARAGTPPCSSIGRKVGSIGTARPRFWSRAEHARFLEALELFGSHDAHSISAHVGTRTVTQVRTHAQKYFLKRDKSRQEQGGSPSARTTGSFASDSKLSSCEGEAAVGGSQASGAGPTSSDGESGSEDDHL